MKVNATLLGLMAMTAAAAAIPAPEAEAFGSLVGACGVPGEPCHKVKRAALAINDILKRHAENNPVCREPNSYCEKQRKSLDEIAELALDGYDEVVRREAEAEAEADPKKKFFGYCGAPGSMCWRKRDVEAEEEAEATQDLVNHCSEPGSFCAAKRTAEPEKRHLMKRCAGCDFLNCDKATKEFCKKLRNQKWHEKHPNYWKNHPKKHPKINPKTGVSKGKKGQHKPFFGYCGAPHGIICWRKRDAHPQDAAEADGFGETIYAIRDAVEMIKREAEAEQGIEDPMDKIEHCEKSRCSPMTLAHLYAAKNNAAEAEEAEELANGPDGPSYEIQPYFDDLEERINSTVTSMED